MRVHTPREQKKSNTSFTSEAVLDPPAPQPVSPHNFADVSVAGYAGGAGGGDPHLQQLLAEVKATDAGKMFLKYAKVEPRVVWGHTENGMRAEFDGDHTITLNIDQKSGHSDGWWKQAIAFELGNLSNQATFDFIDEEGLAGSLSEDDYVRAKEKVEFDSRNVVLDAYEEGQFGAPGPDNPSLFFGGWMSFDDYLKGSVEHSALYRDQWKADFSKKYFELHPDKRPAKKKKH